jgi:hypothetical protein
LLNSSWKSPGSIAVTAFFCSQQAPGRRRARARFLRRRHPPLIKSDPLYAKCASATPPPVAVCQTGVMDAVLHPVEPFAVRLSVVGVF